MRRTSAVDDTSKLEVTHVMHRVAHSINHVDDDLPHGSPSALLILLCPALPPFANQWTGMDFEGYVTAPTWTWTSDASVMSRRRPVASRRCLVLSSSVLASSSSASSSSRRRVCRCRVGLDRFDLRPQYITSELQRILLSFQLRVYLGASENGCTLGDD